LLRIHRTITFEFDPKNGDLVDTNIPESSYCIAATALADDAQAFWMAQPKNKLKQYIPAKGGQVYVIVRGVSRSGISRQMSFFVIEESHAHGARLLDLTYDIADLLNLRCKAGALTVRGCGMDMSFAVMDRAMGALYGGSGNDVSINVL